MNLKKNRAGFTMVELIIVIAIIAILAGIVFVAINPAKRFAEARNAKRWTDVSNLLDAILKYQVDNSGVHATGVPSGDGLNYLIGTDAGACSTTTCGVALQSACKDLTPGIAPDYIGEIPKDLKDGTTTKTLYYISQNTAGRITIGACAPELGAAIKITR